jgi:predicted dehydrogenase
MLCHLLIVKAKMMRKVIRFGIIGCGLMGREFASASARWCHLTKSSAKPEIVGVCDTNLALTDWFAENLPSVKSCTSDYRELLANPNIDAIYCAVPHAFHAAMYVDIIRAGKHLLGEKPFGMDQEQNHVIAAAIAERPDVFVRCSSEMPFYPGAQRVYRAAVAGLLGDIIDVEVGFLHSSDLNPSKTINWKRMEDINGRYGCMGDLGMHVLHLPLRLGWKPKQVFAQLTKIVKTRPDGHGATVACTTWDNATLHTTVEHLGKCFPMTLKTWRIAPGESNTWFIRILGTKKSVSFTTKSPRQWQWMDYKPGGTQAWCTEDLGYESLFPSITGHIFEFGFPDAIQQMWAAYIEEIAGSTDLLFGCVTPKETRDHHAILTAALVSHERNANIAVEYGV